MTRSPLNYPMGRGTDADGAADLQTDVMRFMAILSLCLVAIFALVQSIPPTPLPPEPQEPATAEPKSVPAPAVVKPRPEPPAPRQPERPVARVQAAAPPVAAPAEPTDPSPSPTDEPRDEGFTLRFESEDALRRLVARGAIGFYAIRERDAKRMNVSRGRASFWPASLPAQYHEMDAATVPADVASALRRSGTPGRVTWGVTLPATLSRELERYLDSEAGGELVISANGSLRLEQAGE